MAIDEGHRNFHTKDGRYAPMAKVLEADGCQVVGHRTAFETESLKGVNVLVIANPLPAKGTDEIRSAFSPAEIELLVKWVREGGALMLIADHRPYGEATADLAKAFGVEMSGGFVVDQDEPGPILFSTAESQLADHEITRGREIGQRVDRVVTFTGQALRAAGAFEPLLTFDKETVLFADRASINRNAASKNVAGWHQGMVSEVGRGRIAVFGEAAMFSAQLSVNERPMGMNAPAADQNEQFLLNVLHWLTRKL